MITSWFSFLIQVISRLQRPVLFEYFPHESDSVERLVLQSEVNCDGQLFLEQGITELSLKKEWTGTNYQPVMSDPETILNFAKMSANSYKKRNLDNWRNLTGDYTDLDGFGWNQSGLRGHIYANAKSSLVVIGFKGTSTLLMGGGTISMDKYMDNMMFSCCCARIDISWIPICGCYSGPMSQDIPSGSSGKCNQTCLSEVVKQDPFSYYQQAVNIVRKVQQNYPNAQLWFTGHSMGGAIASLMAVTFSLTAAVTFEAPGERLYASRLGIHQRGPFWAYPIWNFGITRDPVYMGTCQGLSTSCYLSGYAMETKCRHGRDCVIDVDGGYDVTTHRIDWIIDNVLQGQYRIPRCRPNVECEDCVGWVFE